MKLSSIATSLMTGFSVRGSAASFSPAALAQYYGGDTLYDAGPGMYGGRAYQDSQGNYYDDDTSYSGKGLYGGGTLVDKHGTVYDCDTSGYCTP